MSTRREFVKNTALAGSALALAPSLSWGKGSQQDAKLKLAFIGVGLRGTNHLRNALQREDVQVTAICDIDDRRNAIALKMLEEAGQAKPKVFNQDEYAYRDLLELVEVDGSHLCF